MTPTIGFVLVTHGPAEQTLGLCERLNAMFGEPPIAIHHDFSQTEVDTAAFPRNVRFVEKWVRTSWATMAVVDALLSALRLLYRTADPDWVVSLSASDYPIQTAERILGELGATEFDGFFDTRLIEDTGKPFVHQRLDELAFNHPRYPQTAFNRYVAIQTISAKTARWIDTPVERWVVKAKFLTDRLTPFHDGVQCFAGDAWFTANRKVARLFLEETPFWRRLNKHYRSRPVPEESFYQTLVGNTPGLNISANNLRYTDWKGCYAHPRTLERGDFPRLLASGHHFARKFPLEPEMLRELDAAVAAKANVGV